MGESFTRGVAPAAAFVPPSVSHHRSRSRHTQAKQAKEEDKKASKGKAVVGGASASAVRRCRLTPHQLDPRVESKRSCFNWLKITYIPFKTLVSNVKRWFQTSTPHPPTPRLRLSIPG